MKPRVGVYLSKGTAARLTSAAMSRRATKSALVEAALDRFFNCDDTPAPLVLNDHLSELRSQIDQLDRDLGIVSEIVSLHARFHLSVTPEASVATRVRAHNSSEARSDEFGAHASGGTPLGQATMGGADVPRSRVFGADPGEGTSHGSASLGCEPRFRPSRRVDGILKTSAAVGEDGSSGDFPAQRSNACTEPRNRSPEAVREPEQAALAWQTVVREGTSFLLEHRALILRVFLPFVAGYYLSYLFRTINAVVAAPITADLALGAGDLGLLTSVYFLTFAAAQIPIGVFLDRYGPRRIQSVLLLAAAAGAALFAASDNFLLLLAGRALMGLGVAAALTAGLKALVLWFPQDRVPLLSGMMIMLGALGAVTATSPADLLLNSIGWRGLFALFAAVTAGCATMIYLVVPEAVPIAGSAAKARLQRVYTDPGFWRLAPLSATSIGTAWALHGLWAAQWLSDVKSLSRTELVGHLFVMAVAVSLGALLFGVAADRLRRRGIGPQALLGLVATVSIAAQLALILRWPLPSYLLWAVVAATGAATVLSYAVLADRFPKELAGRANGLLNFFHIGAAFVVQTATGLVLQRWAPEAGHYPEIAYQAAFALNLALQVLAGIWFCLPWLVQSRDRTLHAPSSVGGTCKIRQVPLPSNSGSESAFFGRRSP